MFRGKDKRIVPWLNVAKGVGKVFLNRNIQKNVPRASKAFVDTIKRSAVRGLANRPNVGVKRNRRLGLKFTNDRGFYRGSVKTSRKGLKSKLTKYPVHIVSEVSGVITDTDCVYLEHVSIDQYEAILIIVKTLIRKLMEKAGFIFESDYAFFPSAGLASSAGYSIALTNENTAVGAGPGPGLQFSYDFGAADKLREIAIQFMPSFIAYSSGGTTTGAGGPATNIVDYRHLILFDSAYGTAGARQMSTLDLRTEFIHIMGKSELKVQNRTRSADGTENIDNVNNNPLVGYVYDFSGMPKSRVTGYQVLGSIEVNQGVRLVRAGDFVTGAAFNPAREPPLPKTFTNCIKGAKIRLDPGQIKSVYSNDKKSGYVLPLMRRIRLQYGPTSDFLSAYTNMKTQMVALEDVINVNAIESIEIAYEVNRELFCYSQTKTKFTNIHSFTTTSYSNP